MNGLAAVWPTGTYHDVDLLLSHSLPPQMQGTCTIVGIAVENVTDPQNV